MGTLLEAIGIVLETYFGFGFPNRSPIEDSLRAWEFWWLWAQSGVFWWLGPLPGARPRDTRQRFFIFFNKNQVCRAHSGKTAGEGFFAESHIWHPAN